MLKPGEEELQNTRRCSQNRSVGGLCVFVHVVNFRTYYYSSQEGYLWLSMARVGRSVKKQTRALSQRTLAQFDVVYTLQ